MDYKIIYHDKNSSMISYDDRATCIIFGDGAGAVLFEPKIPPDNRAQVVVTRARFERGVGAIATVQCQAVDESARTCVLPHHGWSSMYWQAGPLKNGQNEEGGIKKYSSLWISLTQ